MLSVTEYREVLTELTNRAASDLRVLLSQASDGVVAREILEAALPDLVDTYGSAAASVSADWYDDLRAVEAVPGRYRARVAGSAPVEQLRASARWGIAPLFTAEPDWALAVQMLAGSVQRHVTDQARQTVIRSSLDDPQAQGWRRVTAPGACGFCRMLADRGAVYSTATVDFGSHDNCGCTVAPAWSKTSRRLVRGYTPTTRDISDADRARTRAWMAANGY